MNKTQLQNDFVSIGWWLKNMFSPSAIYSVILRITAVDILNFGRGISIAITAHAVIIASGRQHRRTMSVLPSMLPMLFHIVDPKTSEWPA